MVVATQLQLCLASTIVVYKAVSFSYLCSAYCRLRRTAAQLAVFVHAEDIVQPVWQWLATVEMALMATVREIGHRTTVPLVLEGKSRCSCSNHHRSAVRYLVHIHLRTLTHTITHIFPFSSLVSWCAETMIASSVAGYQ